MPLYPPSTSAMRKAGSVWLLFKTTTAGVPVSGRIPAHCCLLLRLKVRKCHCLFSYSAVMKMEITLPQVATEGGSSGGRTPSMHMHADRKEFRRALFDGAVGNNSFEQTEFICF